MYITRNIYVTNYANTQVININSAYVPKIYSAQKSNNGVHHIKAETVAELTLILSSPRSGNQPCRYAHASLGPLTAYHTSYKSLSILEQPKKKAVWA